MAKPENPALIEMTRGTEFWLRQQGLPFFVARGRRASLLVCRIAPFLVFMILIDLAQWLAETADIHLDGDGPEVVGALILVLVLLGMIWVAVPVTGFLLTSSLVRQYPGQMRTASWLLIAYYLLADPWVSTVGTDGFPLGATIEDIAIVVGALLVTFSGAGALVGWGIRSAFRQLGALGAMTTRALPLLMLVVVFAFFARALWEVTSAMSVTRIIAVALFFAVLGLIFIVPITRREMSGLDERIDTNERLALIDQTPLEPLAGFATEPGAPLSRVERLNLSLVLLLAQAFQVAIFAALTCLFLIVLGEFAFSTAVLREWLGREPTSFDLLGVSIQLDAGLVKTAIFLSCVSSLNFLVSAANGAAYRSALYDPLFAGARVALAVRSAYRALPLADPRAAPEIGGNPAV